MRAGRHLAAVVAPFRKNLSPDEPALRQVCRNLRKLDGIEGLVVNAHASEIDSLITEEQIRMVKTVDEEAQVKTAWSSRVLCPFPIVMQEP